MISDDERYQLQVTTTLMSALEDRSVGRKLVFMITQRMMTLGSAIATADPDLPVATTKESWMGFAEAWKARAQEDGVATIVLGHDVNDRLRSICVGDLHGHLMAVPVMLFESGNDVEVPLPPPGTPQWILACMPQLSDVMKNRRIVKVIAPADKAHDLVSDRTPFPVLDPVIVAECMAPEKFDWWVNRKVNKRWVETTRFGIKLAVHYFCGRQDGPYLPDEFPVKKERQAKRMAEWPCEGGPGDYSIAQKRWTLQMSLTSILSVLSMAGMFMMPSVMNMKEDRLGEALGIVMRNMGFAVDSDVEYWGRSPTLDGPGPSTINRRRGRYDCSSSCSSNCNGSDSSDSWRAGVPRTDWRDDSHDTHPGRVCRANIDEDNDGDESWTTASESLSGEQQDDDDQEKDK